MQRRALLKSLPATLLNGIIVMTSIASSATMSVDIHTLKKSPRMPVLFKSVAGMLLSRALRCMMPRKNS